MSRLNNLVYSGNILKGTNDVTGMYRARVEDVKDPLGVGRVRVRIPKFHGLEGRGGLELESLPWATMVSQSAGFNYGSFVVPEVGEFVMIQFEDDDPNKPVYMGSLYGSGSRKPKKYTSDDEEWESEPGIPETPEDAQGKEPTRKILYKSKKGAEIAIDEHKGEEILEILDASGQSITMSCPNLSMYDSGEGENSDRDINIDAFNGQSVAIHSGGDGSSSIDVSLPSGESVSLSSESGTTLSCGQAYISISKDGTITLCGNRIDIKSNEGIDVECEKEITIMGEHVTIGKSVTILEGEGGGGGAYIPDTGELTPEEIAELEKELAEMGIDYKSDANLAEFLSKFYFNQKGIQDASGLSGLCNFSSYMMLAAYYSNKGFSTGELAALAKKWCRSDGWFTQQSACMSQYGFNVSGNIKGFENVVSSIKSGIDKGNPLILHCRGYWGDYHTTSNGHFMVVTGYNSDGIKVADPGKRANNTRTIPWSAVEQGTKTNDVYVRTSSKS